MRISRLHHFEDKLTPGTILGLSYIIYDAAYATRRPLPIQQLTVLELRGNIILFLKQDGHYLYYALDDPITYLRFGPAPYYPHENIL